MSCCILTKITANLLDQNNIFDSKCPFPGTSPEISELNWKARLKIVLDAAQGISLNNLTIHFMYLITMKLFNF